MFSFLHAASALAAAPAVDEEVLRARRLQRFAEARDNEPEVPGADEVLFGARGNAVFQALESRPNTP
jgi:hypothetical protein